ncbi:transporter [Cognatitamlana onchidii]|uniref:transporter n=1 Tax=Cognatitamlana onchidii TaxID=2562860 RepID=UPI0010A63430|nr:transporter [Algibacter onchidii]
MKNLKNLIVLPLLLLMSLVTFAQEEDSIDASKPTNFYSFVDNTLEYSSQENQNVMGYRGKLTLAPSAEHLVLFEAPLLYNDRTEKFGLGDLRARYFWLPYKNYDKTIGAFGPSIDVFAPTGSFENGLGSGRWIVSPGVTVGIMAADWIQFFPIASYQYASKPVYDNPIPAADMATHGLSFQVITPIVFSEKFFVQLTPVFKMNNFNDERNDRFEQEAFAAYSLNPKMQLTAFYSGKFEDKNHTVSAGLSVFF